MTTPEMLGLSALCAFTVIMCIVCWADEDRQYRWLIAGGIVFLGWLWLACLWASNVGYRR